MARLAIRATGGEREKVATSNTEVRADIIIGNKKVAHVTMWDCNKITPHAIVRIEKLSKDIKVVYIDHTSETHSA
jgi:hypothetical protein